ncbi:MAG: FecR domain-containing protein [Clostridia bacterium]
MRSIVALLAALACTSTALAQEVAGRVLFSLGDVAIVRGGAIVVPGTGTNVFSGDTIRVGEHSHFQMRLTDESLVALQPKTTLQVTEYAFADREPGEQRAIFKLAAGAMRTVTGLIGRINKQDYRVQTPTATIGIRGTHYQVAYLESASGSLAAGTYGAVTDGRIVVTNQGGERVFGADQHFLAASATQPAVGRAGPPPRFGEIAPPVRRPQQPPQQQAPTPATAVLAATGDSRVSNASNGVTLAPAAKQDPSTSTSVATGGGTTTSDAATVSAPVAAQPASLIQVSGPATVVGGATIVQPSLSGTVFYRLEGPFNLPLTCTSGCGSAIVNGNITLGVNLTLQRAVINVNVSDGTGFANVSTPSPLGGIPITISNGQITFSQTVNLADFPQNQGQFRCSDCGAGNTPSFFQSLSVSGVINGSQATLNLSGVDPAGGGGGTFSFSATLPQVTPPNFVSAAAILPNLAGGSSNSGGSYWAVSVDGSGRLLQLGPGSVTSTGVGNLKGSAGTATNSIAGSAPTAGNLVWGAWTGAGAQITDFNYSSFTTGSGGFVPWITGTTPNTLPPSLGSFSYTPIGSLINNGVGILNSASLTADFNARSLTLSLNATNPAVGNTFQMNAVNSFSPISGRFGGGFNSLSCTGPCTGPAALGGSYNGFFAGQSAEGAGVAFSAGFSGNGVSGVVAFKR